MRVACRRTLPILALFGLLTAIQTVPSAVSWGAEPAANAAVVTTYPQIVRLSYVQGDVRVARGKEAEKLQEQDPGSVTGWEQAAANLPLATGYSLATGTGRAEIEFEDASVVYLGENSVLRFNQLSTTSGVPYTELMLLTGTATMNVQTQLPGEIFRMFTPGDSFTVVYPKKAYLRINSYLDAIAVTPQQNAAWYSPIENAVGRTVAVHNGRPVPKPEMDAAAMVEWDSWVAQRVSARDVELAATMKESGLTEPIPGLAEMSGKGKFFACEPYGTCWEPTEGWTGHKAEGPQVEAPSATASGTERAQAETQPAAPVEREAPSDDQGSAVAAPSLSDTPKGTGKLTKGDAYLASHPGATLWTEDYTVPCVDYAISDLMAIDPVTGKEVVVDSYFDTDISYPVFAGYPRFGPQFHGGVPLFNFGYGGMFDDGWDWAVCHSGSWIRWRHHYVWVAGTKRHHHPPFRWVKNGREVGFVPLHPRDVAGKIPVNMRDGFFKATKKGGTVIVQRVNFKEGKQVEPMTEAPKEFRKPVLEPLKIAEAPHADAHSAFSSSVAGRGTAIAASTAGKGTATSNSPIARGTVKAGSAVESGVSMRQPGMPITFDRKTQSFSVSRPVTENGRQSTVAVPLSGGGNGYPAARGTVSYGGAQSGSNGGGGARSYSPAPSNNNGTGSTSRTSAPAPSYSEPARSYSPPAQSYSPPAQSYSPPAQSYSPPAQSYSPPPSSNNGGGSSGGSGGASHR
jgi:hypothetical protein